jgi:hypothetical protein
VEDIDRTARELEDEVVVVVVVGAVVATSTTAAPIVVVLLLVNTTLPKPRRRRIDRAFTLPTAIRVDPNEGNMMMMMTMWFVVILRYQC